jgi:hypothetical protein
MRCTIEQRGWALSINGTVECDMIFDYIGDLPVMLQHVMFLLWPGRARRIAELWTP